MQRSRRRRGMARLVPILALIYGAMVLLNPWAIHMGGQWTPMLIWTGTGELVTGDTAYPLLVTVSPSPHSSGCVWIACLLQAASAAGDGYALPKARQ